MKQSTTKKNRKQIKTKMAAVLESNLKALSPEYKKILVDDLVSAFESRLLALSRAQCNSQAIGIIREELQIATQ